MAEIPVKGQGRKRKNKNKLECSVASLANVNQDSVHVNKHTESRYFDVKAMKASLKEVEVTVTQSVTQETDSSSSKKKKNKAGKDSNTFITETAKNANSLLNFSESGIHLMNYPEISITYTDASENISESAKPDNTVNQNTEEKGVENINSKKKRKNKKKVPLTSCESLSTTTSTASYSAPTYTKVVTSDNTCVLVVNHENFSICNQAASETVDNTKVNSDGINAFSSEKSVKQSIDENSPSESKTAVNSVSMFPVLSCEKGGKSAVDLNTLHNTLDKGHFSKGDNAGGKTKAQLKAERREKQEAQRAAKLAKTATKPIPQNSNLNKNTDSPKEMICKENIPLTENPLGKKTIEKETEHKNRLFSHLPPYKKFDTNANIHPAILELGFRYNKGIICGSNARCISLLAALQEVIIDFVPECKFSRDLETKLQQCLNFLNNCRPLSVSMINCVKFLKYQINHTSDDIDINETKHKLCSLINKFVTEEILLAKEAISNSASAKIVNGDTILVFAHSSLVKDMLCKAHTENKVFHVIVADSRPKLESLSMLQYLVRKGIQCSYISVSAVSIVMKEVSKVIIGAHALLSNGCVMSRLGCKSITLLASSYSVPVLVCCETYKFCERVLTDSIVYNELGEPNDIASLNLLQNGSLENWQSPQSLQLLNLLYDVTTPDLISMVITEKGVLPCTSVPVVLRVRYAELND